MKTTIPIGHRLSEFRRFVSVPTPSNESESRRPDANHYEERHEWNEKLDSPTKEETDRDQANRQAEQLIKPKSWVPVHLDYRPERRRRASSSMAWKALPAS